MIERKGSAKIAGYCSEFMDGTKRGYRIGVVLCYLIMVALFFSTAIAEAGTISLPTTMANYTSYATGDDGDLKKGVAWPDPRFTDNSDGTVTDNLTGLIWMKIANCAGATRNWATALTDVASLNSAGTMNSNDCGDTSNGGSYQTDWRLPNRKELKSIIDYGESSPALATGHPFTSVQASSYWSATTYAPSSVNAWIVHLSLGSVSNVNKTLYFYVWPVRAGQ